MSTRMDSNRMCPCGRGVRIPGAQQCDECDVDDKIEKRELRAALASHAERLLRLGGNQ